MRINKSAKWSWFNSNNQIKTCTKERDDRGCGDEEVHDSPGANLTNLRDTGFPSAGDVEPDGTDRARGIELDVGPSSCAYRRVLPQLAVLRRKRREARIVAMRVDPGVAALLSIAPVDAR